MDGLIEPLYRFLLRMTRDRELAADLTQEALMRAWRRRHSLKNDDARRGWLFQIATNLYRDDCRRRSRCLDNNQLLVVDRTRSPEESAVEREFHDHVVSALDQLPGRQRQVMHLRVVEQLTPAEIAEILGIDAGAVRSSLAAARRTLRVQLRHLLPEDETAECPGPRGKTKLP